MTVVPGFIDPHTHFSIGDWAPMASQTGILTEGLLQGITTVLDEWLQFEGLPLFHGADPDGAKVTALISQYAYKNYRFGGAGKFFGGALTLVKGLKEADFKELKEKGVWRISQIGGSTNITDEKEILRLVGWARKNGFFVSSNLGPGVLKESLYMTPELVSSIRPDKIAHLNGGTTAPPWRVVRDAIDGTGKAALEIVPYGNLKMARRIVSYLRSKGSLGRLVVGSDTPTGQGYFPVAVQRAVIFLSSVCGIPAEQSIAAATGKNTELYSRYSKSFNMGKIMRGMAGDLVVIDAPPGSVGKDALKAIEAGDTFGTAGVIVDGNLVGLRGKDTRPTRGNISLNGRVMKVTNPEETLFDPPRFFYRSTGPTYKL